METKHGSFKFNESSQHDFTDAQMKLSKEAWTICLGLLQRTNQLNESDLLLVLKATKLPAEVQAITAYRVGLVVGMMMGHPLLKNQNNNNG